MTLTEIRKAARVSQIQVAVRTGTSEPTVRLYEANPDALSNRFPHKRAALDRYYEFLRKSLNPDESERTSHAVPGPDRYQANIFEEPKT